MKAPTLTPVKSSNIQAVGHNAGGLFVRFAGGSTYRYPDVPKAMHDKMLKAESVGGYFANEIRGKFAHKPVE